MRTIPISWLDLAQQPVDSPHWKAKDGTEYMYFIDKNWIVINEVVGSYRVRSIAKIVRTFKVK